MATRTFLGGNMNAASSYAENAVPVAGDDVIVSASAGNGWLTGRLPATGQLNSFIVNDSFANTLNLGDFDLCVGTGNLAGVIFNCGNNAQWQCGSGKLYLYSSSTTANTNQILLHNSSMANVNVHFDTNGTNRVFTIVGTTFNCKNLISGASGQARNVSFGQSANLVINIYGSIYGYFQAGNFLFAPFGNLGVSTGSVNLYAANGEIYLQNHLFIINAGTINVYGNYTLTSNVYLVLNHTGNQTFNIAPGGSLTTGAFLLSLSFAVSGVVQKTLNFNNNTFGRLQLYGGSASYPNTSISLASGFAVTDEFIVNPLVHYAENTYIIRLNSTVSGTKRAINLGNNCKYYLIGTAFQDISFNKPVAAFKSSVANCDNIRVVDFPIITVNSF